jgi:hypothetical protein
VATEKSDDADKRDQSRPLSSPYGPHPDHADDASGGADSSPFETMSSDERAELLKNRRPDAKANTNAAPGDENASRH